MHTGKKVFQCEVYEKEFSLKDNLQHHMLTHTEGKAQESDICYKKFTLKGSLTTHFRTEHLGEKLYGCKECDGKWYTTSGGRNYHLRIHHK